MVGFHNQGLMLPSGNDAAQAIAENLGRVLQTPMLIRAESLMNVIGKDQTLRDKEGSQAVISSSNLAAGVPHELPSGPAPICNEPGKKKKESPTRPFLLRMNKLAESLGMTNTVYCNPHGLMNKFNFSSCLDVGKLLVEASHNEEFMAVVGTLVYSTEIMRDGEETTVEWTNTHKCFDDKRFVGGKTGTTVAAGACLSTFMKLENGRKIVIVVLNSRNS